ncbi:hypothetical protein TRFO_22742 [Tritrichomonas foetus]|uniref:COP9 signalosome complex subunit 4 n=1 Tax=Tritrichomonas foetus TaxID=1144522 RepID=A0A1J4KCF3_9EUKA|nr:hypothetical protein TRFO_22742 [Tritrichomonas foetus]|eukprot:OHT08658.1 hypothetical protein TRFO_22742 [Tritrichomonas foetus]
MTNYAEQLVNIVQDFQDGGNKLKSVIDPILQAKNFDSYRQVFDYISDRRAAPVITSPMLEASISFIKGLSSKDEKVKFYYPLLCYINQIDALYQKHQDLRNDFIKLAEETEHYFELANYYVKEPFVIDPNDDQAEWKQLNRTIFLGEAFLKASDMRNSQSKLTEASSHVFRKSTPKDILERFDNFRAHHSLARKDLGTTADTYYLLSTYVADKDRIEYLRLATTYTILSETGPKQKRQISTLMNDDRLQSLPIFGLLDRLSKKSLVKLSELSKFIDLMNKDPGFSEDLLNKSVQQHNMFCISGLFSTISFSRLAQIIGIKDPEEAVEIMRDLIARNSVSALIDQPNKMIIYKPTQTEQMRKDDSILAFCKELQHFTTMLPA